MWHPTKTPATSASFRCTDPRQLYTRSAFPYKSSIGSLCACDCVFGGTSNRIYICGSAALCFAPTINTFALQPWSLYNVFHLPLRPRSGTLRFSPHSYIPKDNRCLREVTSVLGGRPVRVRTARRRNLSSARFVCSNALTPTL